MESAKKILPFVLIAAVLAVGGYFVGRGVVLNNQGASLYRATGGKIFLPKIKPLDNPKSIVLSGVPVSSNVTESQCKALGGAPLYNYNNIPSTYYACFVPAMSFSGNHSLNSAYLKADASNEKLPTLKILDNPVPTLSESDCIALGGTTICDGADYMGCLLPPGTKKIYDTPINSTIGLPKVIDKEIIKSTTSATKTQ